MMDRIFFEIPTRNSREKEKCLREIFSLSGGLPPNPRDFGAIGRYIDGNKAVVSRHNRQKAQTFFSVSSCSGIMAFPAGITPPPIRGFYAFRAKNRPVESPTPAGIVPFPRRTRKRRKNLARNRFLSDIDAPSPLIACWRLPSSANSFSAGN
jgi:hypothetical protein